MRATFKGGVMALDINSKRVGIAFGDAESPAPRCASWDMPGADDLPRACGALANSISEIAKLIHPSIIMIEAPLQMTNRSAHTALVLISLYGAACAAAHNVGARVVDGHVGTWRRHFIGCGNLQSDEAKAAVMQRCKMLGWPVANHDEGDAAGLWAYCMATKFPKWSPGSRPLFQMEAMRG